MILKCAFNGNFTIPWGHGRGFINGKPIGIPAGRSHDNDTMMYVVCLDYIHTINNFLLAAKQLLIQKKQPLKRVCNFRHRYHYFNHEFHQLQYLSCIGNVWSCHNFYKKGIILVFMSENTKIIQERKRKSKADNVQSSFIYTSQRSTEPRGNPHCN